MKYNNGLTINSEKEERKGEFKTSTRAKTLQIQQLLTLHKK